MNTPNDHIPILFFSLTSFESITMEDLTFGYSKPCIMDVKMGTRTAGENANVLKKNYMISKDKATTTASLGLRIVAARVCPAPPLGRLLFFST